MLNAMVRFLTMVVVVGGLLVAPSAASAGSILFTGTGTGVNSVTLNASALFNVSSSNLTITLRNLGDTAGAAGKDVPGNTLTGVLFDLLPSGVTLTPVSAMIQAGAFVQANKCSISGACSAATTSVGGEFRYDSGAFPGSADRGIASAGYIGGAGNFFGPNLDGPEAVNGVNFGIIGPGAFNPNGGLKVPLIQDEVVFQMTISGGTLSTTDIQNVSFQYGTDFKEPRIPSTPSSTNVPEPATLLLLASGLAAVIGRHSRAGIFERNRRRP